jgi:hypothetical protein
MAVRHARELGCRQALDVGKTLVELGIDEDAPAEGRRMFRSGRRIDWRPRESTSAEAAPAAGTPESPR